MTLPNVERFVEYSGLGLTGLTNVGNSCYLNSCMQLISHTYELNTMLKTKEYKKRLNHKPESVLLLEWDKLRELMWSENCTVSPNGFLWTVRKVARVKKMDLFSGNSQNDIQEFLLFIIDCFHMSLTREVEMSILGTSITSKDKLAEVCYDMMKTMYSKEYSEMLNIFYGIQVSEITAIETNETLSLRPEPISVISLSLPPNTENPTLLDCLGHYCSREMLEGENAWFNDKTNQKENVNRGIIFWSLPNILIIDLKRWDINGRKISRLVTAPISSMDLSTYVKGYNSQSYVYDLYGVCNHMGAAQFGHYTSYIKNANGKWYEFNDTDIREISENNVITPFSYCFFYRKKNN